MELKPLFEVLKASAVVMIPRTVIKGIILYWLWLWFLVPFGIPAIGLIMAVALAGVSSFLTYENIGKVHNTDAAFVKLFEWIAGISVWVVFAWMLHFFV